LRDDGLQTLAVRLRSRAHVERFRAHSSVLKRLAQDAGFVASGVSSAPQYGLNVMTTNELEGYVSLSSLDRLIADYGLMPSDQGANVPLHVIPERAGIPPVEDLGGCIGAVVSALDLVESRDSRSRRAGAEYLASFDAEYAAS